ncbi:MAG: MerC domain-containing protein [Bacteroidota bacterium]
MAKAILNKGINSVLDALGFSASTLCATHCAILPFVMSFLPFLGIEFLSNLNFELVMLGSSVLLAFTSFLVGYYKHHHDNEALMIMLVAFIFFVLGHVNQMPTIFEMICTPIGGFIMAFAHYRNWKLCKEKNCKICK